MESKVLFHQRMLGNNSNPMDAFLVNLGIKTLSLRIERFFSFFLKSLKRQARNAQTIAEFLENHKEIAKVYYPGLKSHESYETCKKYMKNPGAVLAFELKGGLDRAAHFYNSLKVCVKAVSLGTVDTLICHPASTTHYFVPKEQREK